VVGVVTFWGGGGGGFVRDGLFLFGCFVGGGFVVFGGWLFWLCGPSARRETKKKVGGRARHSEGLASEWTLTGGTYSDRRKSFAVRAKEHGGNFGAVGIGHGQI